MAVTQDLQIPCSIIFAQFWCSRNPGFDPHRGSLPVASPEWKSCSSHPGTWWLGVPPWLKKPYLCNIVVLIEAKSGKLFENSIFRMIAYVATWLHLRANKTRSRTIKISLESDVCPRKKSIHVCFPLSNMFSNRLPVLPVRLCFCPWCFFAAVSAVSWALVTPCCTASCSNVIIRWLFLRSTLVNCNHCCDDDDDDY